MNHKQLVKITNIIALTGILLLIYWVFAVILVLVFGLKVFQENITELFGLSIFGILAILAGALILNIMLNLTRIAEKSEVITATNVTTPNSPKLTKTVIGIVSVFVLIAGGLFTGDHLTKRQKFTLMANAVQQVVDTHHDSLAFLGQYRFDETWINQAVSQIELLQATNPTIKQAIIITPDKIGDDTVYLAFGKASLPTHEGTPSQIDVDKNNIAHIRANNPTYLKKSDFIFTADSTKNAILDEMFQGKSTPSQSSYDGHYETFYPYQIDGKTVAVLYLNDYMAYGKLASY